MKLKLIQLPVPDLGYAYNDANIPLAAGYLKSYLVTHQILAQEDIRIIPRPIANWGGETSILEWIAESSTDWVGLTTYMWNLDRNRYLAERIKQRYPSIRIVMGGPEIQPGHPVLNDPAIDCFVIGEGERALGELLRDDQNQRPVKKIYQSNTYLDLSDLPNPYLMGWLSPERNESVFLETMRGCPYQCSYCFYSKTYAEIRFHHPAILPEMIRLAREQAAAEIYLMDPSFNITPRLEERLRIIARSNRTGIPIHTEIRLESVTESIADRMAEAGFSSVEVGLQTTHHRSLDAIGRQWDEARFLEGARRLQSRGITVKTGVILGLPFDRYQDWQNTLDFLFQAGLHPSMEIYPLSLIPGTRLRDQADQFGIRYMPFPPYWVTQTPFLSQFEIAEAITELEERTQTEYFPNLIPHLRNISPDYRHFIDLRTEAAAIINKIRHHPAEIANHLSILIRADQDPAPLWEMAELIKNHSPYTLVQIILESDSIPPVETGLRIAEAFQRPDHFFNHIHYYKNDHQTAFAVRLYHLTSNLETARRYLDEPMYYDLIVHYHHDLLHQG
ncbi:MAG: radical SAM protein, partial [Candidatus Delongbacteria bacterium]|nr:radical SAM protein [Candidatus Delongbacteria bacterium]